MATATAAYASALGAGAKAMLYDTRKTTPGLRVLEKYAVRCAGARCHRLGLHDALLIKDNHLAGLPIEAIAPRVAEASRSARASFDIRFVEVEVDSLAQLEALLRLPPGLVDIVLLDNMTLETLRQAVQARDRLNPTLALEASGGVTLTSIGPIARTGVERISAGAVTHQAQSIDIALDAE
ncbi:MAG TPA: hypothetical protein DEB06_05380 [Phycisphaerales bacterium]|nr:hypothetical protein [Phycisphaerales bacterium]